MSKLGKMRATPIKSLDTEMKTSEDLSLIYKILTVKAFLRRNQSHLLSSLTSA